MRLGLGRTEALLRALGDPHRELRGALIAGTNGKGSVQALVASALRAGGVRVGQTPKPHLQSYRERILVDGRPIAPEDFAALIDRTVGSAGTPSVRYGAETEFELVTAAAFTWFAQQRVDVAIVEVGLGGRLDATNVWDGGVATITNIGLDHIEHLGPTLRDIGREKAMIIKRGDIVVSGATGDGALPVRRRARRVHAPLIEVEPLPVEGMDRTGLTVLAPDVGSLKVGLLGRHQAANAAVALATLTALEQAGIASLDERALRAGFASVRWPGRLELLALQPDVLLDGAHNADGARTLATALDELRPHLSRGRPTLLMGVLADKDVRGMVDALDEAATLRGARIIATTVPDSDRSLDAASLAAAWSHTSRREVTAEPDAESAIEKALEAGRVDDGPVVVCGSLYLVGRVRGRLVQDPASIDPPAPAGA